MRTKNSIHRLAAVAVIAVVAGAGVPAAYAHHAAPVDHGSAVAGMPDGTSMSLEGRLSILDFVNGGGQERIYALVASDGSATRVKFAANASVRQGMFLVVSGYTSHRMLVVQQQQTAPRKTTAAAAS